MRGLREGHPGELALGVSGEVGKRLVHLHPLPLGAYERHPGGAVVKERRNRSSASRSARSLSPALGDVVEEDVEPIATVGRQRRDRDLDRELAAVAVHGRHLEPPAEKRVLAGAQEVIETLCGRSPKTLAG